MLHTKYIDTISIFSFTKMELEAFPNIIVGIIFIYLERHCISTVLFAEWQTFCILTVVCIQNVQRKLFSVQCVCPPMEESVHKTFNLTPQFMMPPTQTNLIVIEISICSDIIKKHRTYKAYHQCQCKSCYFIAFSPVKVWL